MRRAERAEETETDGNAGLAKRADVFSENPRRGGQEEDCRERTGTDGIDFVDGGPLNRPAGMLLTISREMFQQVDSGAIGG